MKRIVKRSFANGIWIKSAWGDNRWLSAQTYFGDRRVERISPMIDPDACLLIFYDDPAAVFPLLLHYRQAGAVSVSTLDPERWHKLHALKPDYVLFADGSAPARIDTQNWRVLWQADASVSKKPGVLLQHR
jgi:hypothetical protein